MYSIRIVAEGVKVPDESGRPTVVPVGTIITDNRAWIHCLPGFRNRPPLAVPADEITTEKVATEQARLEPRRRLFLAAWQKKINAFAANSNKYPIGPDGNFLRDAQGELSGNWSNEDRHIAELAQAHGLKPVLQTPVNEVPAASVSTVTSPVTESPVNVQATAPAAPAALPDAIAVVAVPEVVEVPAMVAVADPAAAEPSEAE